MNGRELFEVWAPRESIWSPWVSPALFAQIECPQTTQEADPLGPKPAWYEEVASPDAAVIVDLPGADCIRLALTLAERGYRPVLIINASPGPTRAEDFRHAPPFVPYSGFPQSAVALDMSSLVKEICHGTPRLQSVGLAPHAPPAFVLDALRLKGTKPLVDDMFDNRWMVFPQDFPSARLLAEKGIRRVTVLQAEKAGPSEDLSHVLLRSQAGPAEDLSHILLRWQQAGIEILAKAVEDPGPPSAITVSRPSRFKALWYRALAIMGLRRNNVGGFGSFIPSASSGG